ncbi:flagellar hook-associated protein 3 FlgL [Pseudobutyrivibrio sp. YE44]|uniref:flagellin N-terminal helical domain-containing protein n=1 Tax=Pseudobutyrivibrio sp. YE44 TaxID=1520802 RepID=UPI0008837232|nr:hypothetical protein [Pseudobutyrivibrio sp. YE44]SDB37986.1 flagellar hook-associated protein 3 FlgL [Pseudobutyrivibrio sp. YE44]
MRVTNKMIMNNAASNINTTKECVNTRNKQMTSQKKIDRPSDDPVVAVRSLRLSTTLSQVTQYYKKNIPDATSWLDVTETSLINIRKLMDDCRTIAVKGSTDTYNHEDRNTMITQLESLQKQIFAEGNADYASRTVFTGFRTNCNLTFLEEEPETTYRITQNLSVEDCMEEHRYYSGTSVVPTTETELAATENINDLSQTNLYRMRLNYSLNYNNNVGTINSFKFGDIFDYTMDYNATTDTYDDNAIVTHVVGSDTYVFASFENEDAWAASTAENIKGAPDTESGITTIEGLKTVGDNNIILIKETGELILGKEIAAKLKKENAVVEVQYDKTGFREGELRPEYYYNCEKLASSNPNDVKLPITYKKFDDNGDVIHFDIEYTIAANQTITINTEASNVFTSDIQRDISEMIEAVKLAKNAEDKLNDIKRMQGESKYASDEDQAYLKQWYDAVKKESDYFNDNMQKLFNTELGKIDEYYATISLGITDLGCKKDSLDLTKTRVGDQQETVQGLQSSNDDLDLSQIIIDYTAAYTAYQASLTAAGKLGESTLLNYL